MNLCTDANKVVEKKVCNWGNISWIASQIQTSARLFSWNAELLHNRKSSKKNHIHGT